MRVESSKMYHEDPRGGNRAEHTTPSRLLRVVGVAGHLSRSGRQAVVTASPLFAPHLSGGRDGQSGQSEENVSKQVLRFTGPLEGRGKNGEVRRGAEPEAVGSTRGARGGTAGSCHLHMEVGTVQAGWQGAPASSWLQGSRLLPIPGLEEVLGEDQQPTEVSRGQITAGNSRGLQLQQSPWWGWRKEHVGTPHMSDSPRVQLPAPGRAPAGPGGGRCGPSCACSLTALPFLLQGRGASRAEPGPAQPHQKRPRAPLLSQARVAAGCRLLQRDHQADYQCLWLKGKMEQPCLPLQLL